MNNINGIRRQLGLSQAELSAEIGVTRGNISHYERQAQEVPPEVARKVIAVAAERGFTVSFDDIYGAPVADEAA